MSLFFLYVNKMMETQQRSFPADTEENSVFCGWNMITEEAQGGLQISLYVLCVVDPRIPMAIILKTTLFAVTVDTMIQSSSW